MEDKNTVIDAKIGNLNELTKVLSVKEQAQEQLLVVMQALGIGTIVRSLKFEKVQGYTLTSLFITLLIVRLWGKTIAGATSNHFHGLCAVSKNTLYRGLLNARIDWRMLLTKITLRFHAILDDTTFQKSEQTIRIFIIKYGRSTHWKVLLTTDTSMNFVRAFELYERRWGIEVIFKECRGYLGLGKCQSRSYNAQIADTTLCFMMYQMLS